jgi:hypothetical protein
VALLQIQVEFAGIAFAEVVLGQHLHLPHWIRCIGQELQILNRLESVFGLLKQLEAFVG